MRKILSLLLTAVLLLGTVSVAAYAYDAIPNGSSRNGTASSSSASSVQEHSTVTKTSSGFVVPNVVTNDYTKGTYTASYDGSTGTLYYENKGSILSGMSWAFIPLADISRTNKGIAILNGTPALFYSMSDVVRYGKVKSIVVQNDGKVLERYRFTREGNLVTRCDFSSPQENVTYTISYDSSQTIRTICTQKTGKPQEKCTYNIKDKKLTSVTKTVSGNTTTEPIRTYDSGRPSYHDGVTYKYLNDGRPTSIVYEDSSYKYSVSMTYYDSEKYMKTALIHTEGAGEGTHNVKYSYTYSHLS